MAWRYYIRGSELGGAETTLPWTTYSVIASSCWPPLSQALKLQGKFGMKSLRSQRGIASLFASVLATVVVGGLCTCIIIGNLQVCLCDC